jgi:hypothetical protein
MKTLPAALSATVVVLALSGPAAASAPTKAQLITHADAICRHYQDLAAPLKADFTDIPDTATGIARLLTPVHKLAALLSAEHAALVRIERSPAYAATIERVLHLQARGMTDVAALESALHRLNVGRLDAALGRMEFDGGQYQALARDVGFRTCGNDSVAAASGNSNP